MDQRTKKGKCYKYVGYEISIVAEGVQDRNIEADSAVEAHSRNIKSGMFDK